MFNISFYSGHNASFTISENSNILEVVDLERMMNIKNISLFWFDPKVKESIIVLRYILKYFEKKYGATKYENVICNSTDLTEFFNYEDSIIKFFNAKNLIVIPHQDGHAYNSFYQSNFQKANIISFDGGGDDGCFNIYSAEREAGIKLERKEYSYNLGDKYAFMGYYCESITQEKIGIQGMLTYSGKLMGLSAYGNILYDKTEAFQEYYRGHHSTIESKQNNFGIIQKALGLPIGKNMITGQLEKDTARTSQYVFEDIFSSVCKKEIENSNENLILTGGCAMNILNNTSIHKLTKTFVSPNPDDRGLSLGFMLGYLKPKDAFDSTYIGPEVWDKENLIEYVDRYNAKPTKIRHLVNSIINGKIIGVVRNRLEHGARALGNRSIICSTNIENMKDILNKKVKGREYFRPFAPVVRLEDVNKYFEWEGESRWMSYCPKVKTEYANELKAITHIDGTARVQTVTKEQNEWLYELLSMVGVYNGGTSVLLNTSFNIAGKPILNTYRDAIWMWQNTEMDELILEDYHFKK